MPKFPDARQEKGVRVSGDGEVREILQRLAASLRGEFAGSGIATDRLGTLEIQEVRSVPGLSALG